MNWFDTPSDVPPAQSNTREVMVCMTADITGSVLVVL